METFHTPSSVSCPSSCFVSCSSSSGTRCGSAALMNWWLTVSGSLLADEASCGSPGWGGAGREEASGGSEHQGCC